MDGDHKINISMRWIFFHSLFLQNENHQYTNSDDERESLLPIADKKASIHQPRIVGAIRNESLSVVPAKRRKPFTTASKIYEEDEEVERESLDEIDKNRPSKVLILNESKCDRITKFPCTN